MSDEEGEDEGRQPPPIFPVSNKAYPGSASPSRGRDQESAGPFGGDRGWNVGSRVDSVK